MTIASVLRLNGVEVKRSISSTGKVLFHTPGTTAAPGAPLKPHTFHGGTAPAEVELNVTSSWWLEEGALRAELDQMMTYYPSFTLLEGDDSEPPTWLGEIDTERGRYKVAIIHRKDHGLPFVLPLAPKRLDRKTGHNRSQPSPHTYLNGALCVASAGDWDASTDTAATVVGWAAHWAAMHAEWRFTGVWPTEGYGANEA